MTASVLTIQLPSPVNLTAGTWIKISNISLARTIQIYGNGFTSTNLYSGMTNEAVALSDTTNNGIKSWVFLNNTKA